MSKVLITGGAGYVGSSLVPELLKEGHEVTVFDTYWYGDVFTPIALHPALKQVKGDIREKEKLLETSKGANAVIHLACISNDPSFDLNPHIGKSINYDAFFNVLEAIKQNGVQKFIYASSSSIYGVKADKNVTEESSADPITDYARFKYECEEVLANENLPASWTVLRPATVCGYSPRLRLDLAVNILTINAIEKGVIKVFGGKQLRPNINIKDMVEVYKTVLNAPTDLVHRQVFNAGYENHSLEDIALQVQDVVPASTIEFIPTNDNRSYHINSDRIQRVLGFTPRHTITEASQSLVDAHKQGLIQDGLNNSLYHNIKRMKELNIS